MKSKILVIVGPTASGKSALAVKLAKKFNGEIVSADSRQVYKGLDVGTGKITKSEMRGIKHHMLDVADPRKVFSASDYKKLAEHNIRYIVSKQKLPMVVGGTGFYIDAITNRVSLPEVPPNKLLRAKLEKLSKERLYALLLKKDPRRAQEIDQNNKVRVIRALEIVEALGKVPGLTYDRQPTTYNFIFIGLKPEKAELENRIYQRLMKRLPGIIREVKKLHAQGLSYKRMYALGLEYRYVAELVQDKMTKSQMTNELFVASKQYAKRQWQWFKRNKQIKWFDPSETRAIERYARSMLG